MNKDPNTWNTNKGDVSTPPTNKLVHIQLSTSNDDTYDYDIHWNQNPYKWDWLKQSCMIRKWIKA